MTEGSVQTLKILITGGLGNFGVKYTEGVLVNPQSGSGNRAFVPESTSPKEMNKSEILTLTKIFDKDKSEWMANSTWKVTSNTSALDFPKSDNLIDMFSGTFQKGHGIFVGGGPGTDNKSVYCYIKGTWNLINARQR